MTAMRTTWLAILSSLHASPAVSFQAPASPAFGPRPAAFCSSRRSAACRRHGGRGTLVALLSSATALDPSAEEPSASASAAGDGNGEELTLTQLKQENQLLHEQLQRVQLHNEQLLATQQQATDAATQQMAYESLAPYEQQRIILEDFEGELVPASADDELCEYDEDRDAWIPGNGIGECPLEPNISFVDALKSRAYWLVGLLALQSCSGFILSRNELLLQNHPVIIYFLTMLVGAGGNAGNQASVRVIRGIALGTLSPETRARFLSRELRMACALSAILSLAGFLRALLFHTPFPETLAVTLALSIIVFSSICLGAVLPLLLQKVGVDPAHSSTTIQVVMDILGVLLTVFVSTLVLDSTGGQLLVRTLGSNLGL